MTDYQSGPSTRQDIDNRQIRLGDVLKDEIKPNSRLKIASATFSMFAFQALKEELEQIEELQFIFTNPTFTTDQLPKEYREYSIPKQVRESSIFGAKYELKLMNELKQKMLAKECAEWVRKKVRFKSINVSDEEIDTGLRIETVDDTLSLDRFKQFDLKELGYEKSLFKTTRHLYHAPESLAYLQEFEDYWKNDDYFRDVTQDVLDSLTIAHKEHSPEFLYYVTLYNLFKDFLEDISEDHLANEKVGFKDSKIWQLLYDFQKDAVESLINKLEKFNGCILADSVGLGKTFTALAVMTYYAYRGKRILVLCPKKLENNWNMYRYDYKNNPVYDRYLQYDVLYHTDLSRDSGISNGIDLALNRFDTYDLVVIDESHNFRNGGSTEKEIEEGKENRYTRLMNRIIREGVETKVLMLSATPVNNRFSDLKNQLALAYEGQSEKLDSKLNLSKSIDDIFRQVQQVYNQWSDLEVEERTTKNLLDKIDVDFFKVLDNVTIARSRKHIREFYQQNDVGHFPKRLKPKNIYPDLTLSHPEVSYQRIYQLLDQLQLTIYQPSSHIYPSKRYKYENGKGNHSNLTQLGRETGVKKLMMINLLKRLESSVQAFRHTMVDVVEALVKDTLKTISAFEQSGQGAHVKGIDLSDADFDIEDSNSDYLVGKKISIDLSDMDYLTWKQELEADLVVMKEIEGLLDKISLAEDAKLQALKELIETKIKQPINQGNKKLIIFSAFATTVDYLYESLAPYFLENYQLHTAKISGADGFKTTLETNHKDLNSLLTYFSPISKKKDLLFPDDDKTIDILIATDVISEGQNLQDADMMVNFDIHWNPVRIIQRFGRVDRIGSQNDVIQLVNFWPNIELDDYINLKSRVEARMKISVLTSTADDNVLNQEEVEDNNYRKKQLERLRNEVVDLEDMSDGVSIMDLGMEDYRTDLQRYLTKHPELAKMPHGLQTVLGVDRPEDQGVLFVLKSLKKSEGTVKNPFDPYILLHINQDGEIRSHLSDSKILLEGLRHWVKEQSQVDSRLVDQFNKKTKDGSNMETYTDLLQKGIDFLVDAEEVSTLDALFTQSSINLFGDQVESKDDFELICFFVLVEKGGNHDSAIS